MERLQDHILPSVASKIIWFLLYWSLLMRASHSLDTLNQGAVFDSSHLLTSRNGFFTLGLSGGYLVINYTNDNIPHPVWSANRNNPMLESSLTIDEFGNFKIANSSGDSFEIYSAKSASVPAATNMGAVLGDDGNFVLKQNESILWQSFDHPTDTLLPGMKLGIDKKNGKNLKLTSWLRDDNPIEGAFTMEWDPTERQLIVKRRGIRFWTSGLLTPENNFENVPIPDSFNHNYNFSVDGESVSYSLLVDEGNLNGLRSNISRWFLNYKGDIQDGQGRAFILSSNNCDGNSTQLGCEKWEGPECRKDGDKYRLSGGNFLAKYVTRDYGKNLSFIDCKDMCWQNCSCTAFNSNNNGDGGTVCEFYSGNYGGEASSDEQLSGQTLMYSIIPGPPPPPSDKKWIWIVTILSVVLIFILASMFWYSRWRKLKQEEKFLKELLTSDRLDDSSELEDGENRNQRLKLYSVALIKAATNSFSSENKLGEGGFGPVYKGRLAEGVEIAVKRLSRSSGQGLVEFKNELLLIAKLQHTNLVRLLGFCIQEEERLLVYEYLPNKSLDFFIFGDQSKRELLDWNKRFNLIEGIAQGLLYLHKYSRLRIIHRDLKASNILLDRDMNPKISDFGMARIFKANENEANTHRIVGTYGYMSPEYAMSGIFSVKSDIYSFGVLLLEIVSGKKNHNVYDYDRMLNLIGYAWDLWKRDEALELLDQTLRGAAQKEQVLRCINVGLLCVEQIPFDRPDMSDVLSMLTNEVRVELPIPKEPAFFVGQRRTLPNLSSVQEEVPSANGLSITEMDGR